MRRIPLFCLAVCAAAFALTPHPQAAPPPGVQATQTAQAGRVYFEPARPAETRDSGTGAVSGVVRDADTNRPVAGALVNLTGGPGREPGFQRPRQLTDNSGRFVFTNLEPAATYRLAAQHPDYMAGVVPQFALTEGQWFSGADVALTPDLPTSITGMVVDERGDPVAGVGVNLLSQLVVGRHTFPVRRASAVTDDRGIYRASGLAPGAYLVLVPGVQVTVRDGSLRPPTGTQQPLALDRAGDGVSAIVGHVPTAGVTASGRAYPMAYHPAGRTHADAIAVTLERGDQRTGVDVQLSLVPTFRLSGTLVGPADAIADMPVWLTHAGNETANQGSEVAMTLTGPAGEFTLLNVPAGDYTLMASRRQVDFTAGGGGSLGLSGVVPQRGYGFDMSLLGTTMGWAGVALGQRGRAGVPGYVRHPVAVVDRDIRNLDVPLSPGVTVSGHYTWDGNPTAPRNGQAPRLDLEPADGDVSRGVPQSSLLNAPATAGQMLTFSIPGVQPGHYIVGAPALSTPDVITSVEWRGHNMAATPLEIGSTDITGVVVHLQSKPSIVSGTVRDPRGTPVTSGTVLLFPTASAAWDTVGISAPLFKSAAITAAGYRSPHLVPGEYFVVAVPEVARAWLSDRRLLTTLAASATKVRIDAAASLTQDLTMTGGNR